MEYTEDQMTEWFDIENHKPKHIGAYEVELKGCDPDEDGCYAWWNGSEFCQPCLVGFQYIEESKNWDISCSDRIYNWRGLNFNPQAPQKPAKKKGNKRKTLYVVFESNYAKTKKVCVGCYSVKKNAEIKSESVPYGFIQEVRFRTPEA